MKPSERTSEDYLQDVLDYTEKAERFMASIPLTQTRWPAMRRPYWPLSEPWRSSEKRPNMSLRLFVGNTRRSRGGAWPECATRSFMDTSEWMPPSSGEP
jgi:hypothetical protein